MSRLRMNPDFECSVFGPTLYITKRSRPKIEILGKNKVGLQYTEDLNTNCILRNSGDTKIGHLLATLLEGVGLFFISSVKIFNKIFHFHGVIAGMNE